jgi:hypothetical protein
VLSRLPAEEEERVALSYLGSSGLGRQQAAMDLTWALLNTREFLYRH